MIGDPYSYMGGYLPKVIVGLITVLTLINVLTLIKRILLEANGWFGERSLKMCGR